MDSVPTVETEVPEEIPNIYTKQHAAFLSVILNHSILGYEDSIRICKYIWDNQITWNTKKLKRIVQTINKRINIVLRKEIKISMCQLKNRPCFLIRNIVADEITRMEPSYDNKEDAYFWLVLCALVNADNYEISPIVCLNITSRLAQPISKTRAEELMKAWVRAGYFQVRGDIVHIGPRTTAECERYIRNNFSDIVILCELCQTSVFYGHLCDNCDNLFHNNCWDLYVDRLKKCPHCKIVI